MITFKEKISFNDVLMFEVYNDIINEKKIVFG